MLTGGSLRRGGIAVAVGSLICASLLVGVTAATATNPIASPGPASGPTLVGAMGAGHDGQAVLLDKTGAVTWRYQPQAIMSVNGVQRLEGGNVLMAVQYERDGQIRTGVRIVAPGDNSVVWNYSFPVATALNSEVHDAEVLPSGNIVLADMDAERIAIINRSTKSVEWQWRASQHYTPPTNASERDWLHINDVDHLGDERFLISVRNANQLLVIERDQGVVEVVNRDRSASNDGNCRGVRNNQLVGDDIRCGSPEILNHQHNPQWLGDGRVLVADSENDRVVELERRDGRWEIAWVDHGANGQRYDWPRDADRLPNGNTLITDTRGGRLVEVDRNGSVVWATDAPPQSYDADRGTEYPAGPPLNGSVAGGRVEQPFEVVSILHGSVQHAVGLPYWLGEWAFLAVFAGIVGAWVGTIVAVIGPRASDAVTDYRCGREVTTTHESD